MIQGLRASRRVLRASGDQERPGDHQGLWLVEVVSRLEELFVGAETGLSRRDESWLAGAVGFLAQISGFPVVHVASRLVKGGSWADQMPQANLS